MACRTYTSTLFRYIIYFIDLIISDLIIRPMCKLMVSQLEQKQSNNIRYTDLHWLYNLSYSKTL